MSRKLMNLALMYTAITAYASEYPFGIDEEGIFYHYGHHIFKEDRMLSEDILAIDWEEV